MEDKAVPRKTCPALLSIEFLNQRHMLTIIYTLKEAPKSFSAIHDQLKINTATLTKRIKDLERVKLVVPLTCPRDARQSYYSLTEKGRKIAQTIAALPIIL